MQLNQLAICDEIDVFEDRVSYRCVSEAIAIDSVPLILGTDVRLALFAAAERRKWTDRPLRVRLKMPSGRFVEFYTRSGKFFGGEQLFVLDLCGLVLLDFGRYVVEVSEAFGQAAVAVCSFSLIEEARTTIGL